MKQTLLSLALLSLSLSAYAQGETLLDLCEKNTSSTYKVYNKATSIAAGATLVVRTARYTDFYPVLTGKGSLELYSGGERTYLGNHSDKSYPNWGNFTGNVGIYPYKAVESGCGFYGVVMNTNGKSYSPEDPNPSGKINTMLANNHVVLHAGAAIATEKSAAGVRIGELNTEAGSRLYGYYKSQSAVSTAYYLLGALNTDATLAGRIASAEKNGAPDATQKVGIIKEGKGTYTLTANDNQLSGSLRVNAGTVLICNDAKVAKTKKYTGGTGAAAEASQAVAFVFKDGHLGGTGNVGGHVDLYGDLVPGVDGQGTLTLANYATSAACNLILHPASTLHFTLASSDAFSALDLSGKLSYSALMEDFTEGSSPVQIVLSLAENQQVNVGDTYTLITARKGKDAALNLKVKLPDALGWQVSEETASNGAYTLSVTCTSLTAQEGGETGDEGGDDQPVEGGDEEEIDISGVDLPTNLYLRQYLERVSSDKRIGVAVPSTWTYNVPASPSSNVSKAISNNFNLCVAENEMKMDALEPGQDYFSYGAADDLLRYARNQKMALRGHTLVWHRQVPEWISADGKKNDKNWTREQLLKILENHITKIVKHFGKDVCEWDVVNETLDDDQSIVRTNPSGYQLRKESVWVKVIGESFIDSAFVYAHRANPDLKLYLNEYDGEFSGSAKTLALYNLAKRLKDSGIPIAGVGLQCHLHADEFDKDKLDATVKKYAAAGLNCILTEIDISIPTTSAADLTRQADVYRGITEVFLHNPNCPHMVIWGINDQFSWVSGAHPVLFDNNTQPKPAYTAVRKALHRYAAEQIVLSDIQAPEAGAAPQSSAVAGRSLVRYNAAGQLLSSPARGLNILRLPDGTVRKELHSAR